jgi:hypothetical protein
LHDDTNDAKVIKDAMTREEADMKNIKLAVEDKVANLLIKMYEKYDE